LLIDSHKKERDDYPRQPYKNKKEVITMAKIDGFSVEKNGKIVRMVKLQCDECGFEWVAAEAGMKKLENIYAGHVCNNCIAKKNVAVGSKWKKA